MIPFDGDDYRMDDGDDRLKITYTQSEHKANANTSSETFQHLKGPDHPAFAAQMGKGRPPGSPNTIKYVRETLARLNFNVIEEAVLRYRDPKTPEASKDAMMNIIANKALPNLKSIEMKVDNETNQSRFVFNIMAAELQQPDDPTPSIEQSITVEPIITTNAINVRNDDDDTVPE